jgi:hypothetical protein
MGFAGFVAFDDVVVDGAAMTVEASLEDSGAGGGAAVDVDDDDVVVA